MLEIRTAYKNIISGGKRTWLNVAVLSVTLVFMIAYNGLYDGWMEEAVRDSAEQETGDGQFWHPAYERYDVFSLQDAHGVIPNALQANSSPVLVVQGSVYPQGRMQNVLLKGIDPQQQVLKIPSEKIVAEEGVVPAMIGRRMAKSIGLDEGGQILLRWRDKNGVFDAREIMIVHVFETKVSGIDNGQIWLSLHDLQKMTGMTGEATYIVVSGKPQAKSVDGWGYKSPEFLMADLISMEQAGRIEALVIYIILLSIALLAVFDTQTLSIFRRQKEIGTLIALGMTPKNVAGLFTIEGAMYSILAILAAVVWGTPVLFLFAKTGFPLPDSFDNVGMSIGNAMYPVYKFSMIVKTIFVVVILSALISFLPAQKIARQNVVYALKGKIN